MKRSGFAFMVVVVCACGEKPKPVPRGISDLMVMTEKTDEADQPTEFYLHVRFRYRPTVPQPTDHGVEDGVRAPIVRAACQVGAFRFVQVDEANKDDEDDDGKKYPPHTHTALPYALDELPARPSMCELQIFERLDKAPKRLVRVCVRDGEAPVDGACPPNAVDGPGQQGFSVPAFDIAVVPTSHQNPAHLLLRYTVQSHDKPRLRTRVDTKIECPDGAHEEIDHPEAGALDVGEAFKSANIKLGARVPPPAMGCTVTFASVNRDTGVGSMIQQFCYRDRKVSPGACPP